MPNVRMNQAAVFGYQSRLKIDEMIACIVAPQDFFI